MKKTLVSLLVLASALPAFADGNKCLKGQFEGQTYEIVNQGMDNYGNFQSTLTLSNDGELKGKGRYFATQEEAYLETKYTNRKGLKAVVSTSYQQDGALFTLCVGTDLKKADQYKCTSCIEAQH